MVVRLLNQRERRRKNKRGKKKKKKSRARVKEETAVFRTTTSTVNQKCARFDRSVFQPRSIFGRFAFVKTLSTRRQNFSLSFRLVFLPLTRKFHCPGAIKSEKKNKSKRAREYLSSLRRCRTSLSLSLSLYIYKKISLRQNNPMCPSSLVSGWFVACVVVRRKVEFFSLCFFFTFFVLLSHGAAFLPGACQRVHFDRSERESGRETKLLRFEARESASVRERIPTPRERHAPKDSRHNTLSLSVCLSVRDESHKDLKNRDETIENGEKEGGWG